MTHHRIPHRQRLSRSVAFYVQRWNVWRWRRWRRGQQILQHPLATIHRRRAVCVRRNRQQAALAEQSPSRTSRRERYAPKFGAVDIRNTVMFRQPLINKGVVRRQQVEHTAISAQDTFQEKVGLPPERGAERLVKIRKQNFVR